MKQVLRISAVCLIIMIVGVAFGDSADAQQFTASRPGGRAGSWDFYLPLIYSQSATIDGQQGSKVDVDSDWGFGFGAGYNFNDHLQLNGLLSWAYRSYEATYVDNLGKTGSYNNWMDTSTLSLNGIYYFLNGDITPFISGGLGIAYVDTNIQTGAGEYYCWWDPWYGYVCGGYAPTKTENDLSYNAGLGVRFDVNRQFGMQISYNRNWIDISKASSMPEFDIWKLDFILRVP